MNKKAVIRRKWSFEKGRNSSAVIFAALMLSAVMAVMVGFFKYEYHSRGNKEQKGIMVRIDPKLNHELFESMDRRDPARTFGVTGGSFGELYSGKNYEITLSHELPQIGKLPQITDSGTAAIQIVPVPVSSNYAPFLPVGKPAAQKKLVTRVIASDGKDIVIPALTRLKGKRGTYGTVKISGNEFLRYAETIISCGDRQVDRQAEVILKNSGLAPGVYQIYYYDGADGR